MSKASSEPRIYETIIKYLSKPSPLPDILGNEMALTDYGNKLLKDNIKDALESKILPPSLSFIQYFHVSSTLETNPFAAPIIIRKDRESEILDAWAHFRAPRKKHISLIENIVRKGKSGCSFIITRENIISDENRHVGKNLTETCVVQLTDSCASYESYSSHNFIDSLEDEKISDEFVLLKEKTVEKLFQEYETCYHDDDSSPTIDIQPKEAENLLKRTLLPGKDYNEYFHRLNILVKKVDVVFCIPKLYKNYADSKSQSGGGCVFFLNKPVDDETLNKLFVISFKLCSIASSVYDLVRVASQQKETELWDSIRHSIKNVYEKEISKSTPNDVVRRILKLESLAIDATGWQLQGSHKIDPVLWGAEGIDKESIGKTISKSIENFEFGLDIDDASICPYYVDQRLVVIVVELARNLKKSELIDRGKISVSKMPDSNLLDIRLKTLCYAQDARAIHNKLTDSTARGGVIWVSKLCSNLVAGVGNVKWKFIKTDGSNTVEKTTEIESCFISYPNDLLELTEDTILQMEFETNGLNAIRKKV